MIGHFLGYFEKPCSSVYLLLWLLFGQLWKLLGYFLLKHLVTLVPTLDWMRERETEKDEKIDNGLFKRMHFDYL